MSHMSAVRLRAIWVIPDHEHFLLFIYCFIALNFTFKSRIYIEIIFVPSVKFRSRFIYLPIDMLLLHPHLLKKLVFY